MKKSITQKAFEGKTHIDQSLARAVIRQSGGWSAFKEMAEDVVNNGADGGFAGWIYYRETCAFARRNRDAIAELAETMARDLGDGGAVELVQGFNCFRQDKPESDQVGRCLYGKPREGDGVAALILNALAWYALEETCRSYCDMMER